MEPLISVIIPVFNMELYLERCLDSVIGNTYRNLEILCVDDGSTDRSLEILRAYEEKDPRIIVIAKENGGVSSARNAGLDRMTGEYVAFIDPDDFVHPQYFEFLYRAQMETETHISICAFQRVVDKTIVCFDVFALGIDTLQIVSYSKIIRNHHLRAFSGGRLIRSELTTDVRFCQELNYGEDTVFFAEICANEPTRRVTVIDFPLYFYYQREGSLSKVANMTQRTQYLQVMAQKLRQTKHQDDIYLDFVLRVCLPLRHRYIYIRQDPMTAREYTRLMNSIQGSLWQTKIYSLKQKLGFSAFIIFPRLYWLYRFMKDPSMLNREKMEREKQQEKPFIALR